MSSLRSGQALSEAKDLSLGIAEILRFAQDDNRASVNAYGVAPTRYAFIRRMGPRCF